MTSFPKFISGRTLAEERAAKRVARQSHEQAEKAKVRARDKGCRWPGCDCHKRHLPLEQAHLNDKGMGGDPLGRRTTSDQMVRICRPRHQGPESLHSGDLAILPLTPDGANGPLMFCRRGPDGQFYVVAEETAIGITRRD